MSINNWMDMWHMHTMKYCSAIKMEKLLIDTTTWVNFKCILLCERSQTQIWPADHMLPFRWISQNAEVKKWISCCWGLGVTRCAGYTEATLGDSLSWYNSVVPWYWWRPTALSLLSQEKRCTHFAVSSWVQLLSRVRLFAPPWTAARQASLSITNSWSPPKPMSIESVIPSNHLILCRPLLLLPSIFPNIRVFSNESAICSGGQEYWSFSFNISPSNEHLGLISFRMDWLDLLAVQGTLKSLLQHNSSKASILQHSAFFIVQLLHPYMTTGKTIALTRQTFVSKVMSLLFNMLSRLVITFLPRSKHLLISWL